ncbi:hypothetical protein RJ640_024152 [Escallonia rubra]|uniref:CP-type G domain-containing protein n=1 Tax=Escallonia rubra TaxID=112253 RepID=A0AA88R7G4_9ASTE|nr:hypothetical protein RJ640_024152 [Escallonia rubra]
MGATATLVQKLGNAVKKAAESKSSSWWYTPHMAATSRAITERIPLVDIVLEVRDARVPWSSRCALLKNLPSSSNRIIVLNKMDLANRSQLKEWMKYCEEQNCISYGVNSHNKENIKEFLNFLRARVKELRKIDDSSHTTTVMLVGIPNVGKSALANSLHLIGRTSAAEKGRLKHAVVTPQPGETKDISSLKIASHPNVYVLDTPGVLPPEILDVEMCSKLALTGVIADSLVGESELAQYFLTILNLSDEYKEWEKLSTSESEGLLLDQKRGGSELKGSRKRQNPADHTQDFIVRDVRQTLFQVISSFNRKLEDEEDMSLLIELQFRALQKAFHLPSESGEDAHTRVATKLLNLYRTGRLGHYMLDCIPGHVL